MKKHPVLVIHGGAGRGHFNNGKLNDMRDSVQRILAALSPRLKMGASALEIVTLAVRSLEDDPLFNAGRGSKIQSDGHIRMSASIMDGAKRRFAGCVNVERIKNPILLARGLMAKPDRVLAGQGAAVFARKLGLECASPFTFETRKAFANKIKGKSGTVGAVALDSKGRLAAATSTGGKGFEYPHRVSDTPSPAGNFANADCAVSVTGTGEEIIEFSVASSVCALVEAGWPLKKAVSHVIRNAKAKRAAFGFISIDKKGTVSTGQTTPLLIWGHTTRGKINLGF